MGHTDHDYKDPLEMQSHDPQDKNPQNTKSPEREPALLGSPCCKPQRLMYRWALGSQRVWTAVDGQGGGPQSGVRFDLEASVAIAPSLCTRNPEVAAAVVVSITAAAAVALAVVVAAGSSTSSRRVVVAVVICFGCGC